MNRILWDAQNPKATVTCVSWGSLIICHTLVLGSAKTEKKQTPTLRDQVFFDNKGTEDNLNKFISAVKEVRDLITLKSGGL